MKQLVFAVALLLGAVVAPRAHAACGNLSNVCTFADLNGCCGNGSFCDVSGTISIKTNSQCTIDFGPRTVRVLSGGTIAAGTSDATLLATAVTLSGSGKLTATGDATHDGGQLTLGTAAKPLTTFTMQNTASVDVTGGGSLGGGSFAVTTSGPIALQGGAIDASGITTLTSGGRITLTSQTGTITINNKLWSRSTSGATAEGSGGTITVLSGNDLQVGNDGNVSVRGGAGASGAVDFRASKALTLSPQSSIEGSAYPSTGGDGASLAFYAASISALGTITADGGSSLDVSEGGGAGGTVDMEATTGALIVQHGTKGISADGGLGGEGGAISLYTNSMTAPPTSDGTMTVDTAITADGPAIVEGIAGGGDITIRSRGDFILATGAKLSVDGAGDSGGGIDMEVTRDITLNSTLSADSDETSGSVYLRAGHDITFNGNVSLDGFTGTDGSGSGGDLDAGAGNDIRVRGGKTLSAKGIADESGGSLLLHAVQRVRVDKTATLVVDGGLNTGALAGQIVLTSNENQHGGPASYAPDPNFDMIIEGNLSAKGHNTCAGTPNSSNPGKISLMACRLRIFDGLIDSQGDCYASNNITVRQDITVNSGARIRTTAGSNNALTNMITKAGVSLANAPNGSPAFSPSYTGSVLPECTAINQPTSNCLAPCPTCGDGIVNGPWETCDNPNQDRCAGHCNHCRTETCSDGNVCHHNECDLLGGCINSALPDGTSCDDQSVCTLVDECRGGNCYQEALPCGDGIPCTSDQCDAVTGCFHTNNNGPSNDGTGVAGCDDQSICNGAEVCISSTCHAGSPPTCHEEPTDDLDSRDFCANNACQHEFKPCTDASECNDANACTSDTCVARANPGPGLSAKVCRNTALPNGDGCSDNDACTVGDSCQNGTCVRGSDRVCNDGLFCTTEICDSQNGCIPTPVGGNCCETAADCHDGTFCSTTECTNHECAYPAIQNCCTTDAECDDANPCTTEPVGICNANTHQCGAHPLLSGTQPGCGDLCQTGQCVQGSGTSTCQLDAPTVCQDDGNLCTLEVCDPLVGCQHPPIDNCCVDASQCIDTDPCTDPVCNDAHTCEQHERFNGCRACTKDTDCDPLGQCAGQKCDATNVCTTVTAHSCSDGNLNTDDICELDASLNPVCRNSCRNAAACSDNDACNGAETCNAGTCQSGTPLSCDDGDLCTDDSCDTVTGCVHASRTGFPRILCRLDAIDQLIASASSTDIQTPARKKLTTLMKGIRAKLTKAQQASSPTKAKKPLKAAVKQTKAFQKYLAKQSGKKVAVTPATALKDAMLDAAGQIGNQIP